MMMMAPGLHKADANPGELRSSSKDFSEGF